MGPREYAPQLSFEELARLWASEDGSTPAEKRLLRLGEAFWQGDFERSDGTSLVFTLERPGQLMPMAMDGPRPGDDYDHQPYTRADMLKVLKAFSPIVPRPLPLSEAFRYLMDGWRLGEPRGGQVERHILAQLYIERAGFLDWCKLGRITSPKFWCELPKEQLSGTHPHDVWVEMARVIAAEMKENNERIDQSKVARIVRKRLGLNQCKETIRSVLSRRRSEWDPSQMCARTEK